MRDILADLDRWILSDRQIAIATVIQTWGSSPRRAGSKLAIASDGQFSGSVSGGCVENAVMEVALDSLKTHRAQLLHFGVADETAWEVGLACGGSIDVLVKPIDIVLFQALRNAWIDETHSVHVTVIRGSEHILGREMLVREDGVVVGTIGNHRQQKALQLANDVFVHGESQRMMLDDETELFLEFISPPPTLIAVGGVHIAVALMDMAKTLGYRTVVVDPRSVWGNEERFPNVGQLIHSWPEKAFEQIKITRSTAIAMLTHDPKLDDAALKIALTSPAFYVGALGSKTTNAKRRERLLGEGITEQQFSRLHAPIGIDIGASTPEEIALAVMAQVVETQRKRNPISAVNEPFPITNHLITDL
jgi:xanthine dehydrogenase accessory factor